MRRRLVAAISIAVIGAWMAVGLQDAAWAKKAKKAKSKAQQEDALPTSASGFGGVIQGKVVGRRPNEAILLIEKIVEVWKANRAVDPKSLVGRRIVVNCRVESGKPESAEAKFINGLKEGDRVTLEVKHLSGSSLTVIRLPKDPRPKS